MTKLVLRLLVAASVVSSIADSTFAAPARVLDRNIHRVLATMKSGERATLPQVALGRESLDTLQIEPMQVWAADAKILAFGPTGESQVVPAPDVKYFKGRVEGEEESAVFFSRSSNGAIRGMVLIGERSWIIGHGVRAGDRPTADVRREFEIGADRVTPDTPLLIAEIDDIESIGDPAAEWKCEVGTHSPDSPLIGHSNLRAEAAGKRLSTDSGNVSGASYQLRLAIETDDELCAGFENNTTALTTYIGDLIAKASIVYQRDVDTTLLVGAVHLRTGGAGTDPWTVVPGSGTGPALAEFGAYWHANYPQASVPRSSALFLSGKLFNGGVAWLGTLCEDDFFCGASGANCGSSTYANSYGGGYAFNGSSGGISTSVPDPTATVNGVEFGLPASNYWILLQVMHELGHNVSSPHSSCVALTAEEKTLYGVTRNFVDTCLNGGTYNGSPCYAGTTSAPAEKGTIMSYCHNIAYTGSPTFYRASRFVLGKAGEASEKMFPIFFAGLEGATPNPTVAVQAQPVSCATGRTASVPSCSGCTYSWSIDGGTITSSATTSSITYTPNESEVALTVTVIGARGCGITATKIFTSTCAGVLAPANVIAAATSASNVNVSWTASAGASSYNVYRSPGGGAYTLIGSTAATSFGDAGRTADTAYLYKVRAVNGGESVDSNIDLATTVIFTNDPLVSNTSVIAATHLTQLRTAVNAVRALAGLGAGAYTDPTVTAGTTKVKAAHVNELRSSLDAARLLLMLSAMSYGENLTAGTTSITAAHFGELRGGVK